MIAEEIWRLGPRSRKAFTSNPDEHPLVGFSTRPAWRLWVLCTKNGPHFSASWADEDFKVSEDA